MRVYVRPADTGGCGHYRLIWPARHLADQGNDITIRPPTGREGEHVEGVATIAGETIRHVDIDADVVVIQRPLDRIFTEIIPALHRQGTAVVVELDDDFHTLPQGHPARIETAARTNPNSNRMWLRRACERADLVTCTTPRIAARYAPHGRAIILPNNIPDRYLDVTRRPHDGTVYGWTGATFTHVDDLRVCGDGVRDALAAEPHTRFHVIGTGRGVARQLRLTEPDITSTGWVSIADYPNRYAELDVAIAPLQPNDFNQAKSWLKPLEAAAVGVACVASPTEDYRRAADLGLCVLASTPAEWRDQLMRFANPVERAAQVQRAHRAAEELTVERNSWRWWEAWEQARANFQARKANAA